LWYQRAARQDGVAREICWNGIRGGIVDLHHLIGVGEDHGADNAWHVVEEVLVRA
jgi:hypothetical protein